MNAPSQSSQEEARLAVERSVANPRRRRYSLIMLFIITAACAILMTFVAPILRAIVANELPIEEALLATGGGSVLGMAIGSVVGRFHEPVAVSLGIAAGFFVGAFIGATVVLPPPFSEQMATAVLVGSVLLPVLGLISWLLSPKA